MRIAATAILLTAIVGCGRGPQQTARAAETGTAPGAVTRLDPELDALISAAATIDKVSGGFRFLEGPLWRRSGVLWFSDLVGNVVHQWSLDGKVTDVLNPGGFDGGGAAEGAYIGPNGMAAGPDNSVILCQHGNRRIVRVAPDLKLTVMADRFQGKRLNSPNDLVYAADGSLYFTDPPFGLPKQDDDPAKELKINAVFRLANGKLEPVVKDLGRPNGIAFSPDYRTLYISNSEPDRRLWMRCDVGAAGDVSNCRVFADASSSPEQGVPDGMKVDSAGNVYATGPGGIWVFSPDGKHLGTLKVPESPSNCAWGDDGRTLYITAVTSVYKIRVKVAGEKALYN
jgi:gluconolactonase